MLKTACESNFTDSGFNDCHMPMKWNKQWGWSTACALGSLLLTCYVFSCLARWSWTLTRLWAFLLQLPSRLVGVCWRGLHIGLLHTCLQYATTEGSVGTLLFISAHERFYESQLGLASSSSFSVFCPLLCCQNSCLWERHCRHQVLPKQLLLMWEAFHLVWLKSLEMILMWACWVQALW